MRLFGLVLVFIISTLSMPVLAQDDGGYAKLAPLPASALDDGAPIKMSPDGPAIIQLDEDASSLIIGNPAHATAVLENPRQIVLIPQAPGATKIIALNRAGKPILSRHVLVGGGKSGFIRINRACANSSAAGCQPVAMYYCPDRCYQTSTPASGGTVAPSSADAGIPAPAAPTNEIEVPDSVGDNPVEIEAQ